MKSILDPSFRYTPSSETDIRKTFARIRREMARSNPAAARGRGLSLRVVPFEVPTGRAKGIAVS